MVPVGGAKERAALALLALHANHIVSEDRLVDALWPNEPPRTAIRTLQSHLSRLRQLLSDGLALESQAGGWMLLAHPDGVDTVRFETLLARGRGAAAAGDQLGAALAFGDALRLWRGRALDGLADASWAVAESARLEELRLTALEERIEAELACGRHHEVIGDLEGACRTHPLRERLWGQRMLALYRSGRQADALRAYQQLRRTLVEELGIEPNPAVVRLEQAIVTQSPTLEWRPTAIERTRPMPGNGARSGAGLVTLLFTDIVGSTELLGRLGDAAFEEVRRSHFHLLRDAVDVAGGSEVKNLGDGLMAVFPSAVDALGCAVAIQQAVARHNRRAGEQRFAVRVGLHVGEPISDEADFFGLSVVIAKRLCDQAEGGQIVASRLVADLVGARGVFRFLDVGLVDLKGIAEPVAACTLEWNEQASRPLPPSLVALQEAAFVGREPELEKLQRAWDRAQATAREVVLIAGEPGIGKTTLAVRLATAAWEQGAVVLFGRCDEESVVPFQPFVEAVVHYIDTTPPDELRRQLGPQAADLALLVPTIVGRLPELARVERSGAETERYRLFEAVSHLVATVAGDAPLVLVLDDLHWADRPTLQLLTHVIRRVAAASVLIVGTYRDTDLVRTHPMAETLVELRRANVVERVPLRGLSQADVVRMVAGTAEPSPADRALGGALWQETEGNPLFLREILRHLAETDAIVRAENGRWTATRRIEQLGIPEGVKEVIGRRLTRLSDDANTALRTGSVMGRELRLDVLERVTDLGTDRLLDALDDATAAGVIEELSGAIGSWSFTHALVREALYEELSLTRRVRLHQRVGEAIEGLFGSHVEPHLAQLAFHFTQAAVAGNADKAIDYARRAGEHAITLAAYEEAARHFAMALEVAEDAGAAREVKAELLLAQGESMLRLGDLRPPRKAFERVVDLVGDRDPELFARAALGYAGARIRVWWAEIGQANPRSLELLEMALTKLPADDSALRALAMAAFAQELHWVAGTEDKRLELSDAALAMARRLGDPATLAYVLSSCNLAVNMPNRLDEWIANGEESLGIAEQLGDRQMHGMACGHLFVGHIYRNDLPQAFDYIRTCMDDYEAIKDPAGLQVTSNAYGGLAMLEGRFDEAERYMLNGFHIGQEARDPNTFLAFGPGMAVLRLWQGRIEELISVVEAILSNLPGVKGLDHAILAVAFSEIGMVERAQEHLDAVDPHDRMSLPVNALRSAGLQLLARACFKTRDATKAAVVYDELVPYSSQILGLAWMSFGSAQIGLGCAAAACGRLDQAVEHFEAALAVHEPHGWRTIAADIRQQYAAVLAERDAPGDRERCLAMLDTLIADAADIGMAVCLADAVALRAQLSGGQPAKTSRTRSVTRRDRARAKLTAIGRAAVASWTGSRNDDDLVRRFSTPRAQRTVFAAMARSFQPAMAFGFEGDITVDLRPVDDDGDPAAGDWWTIEVRDRKATSRPGPSVDAAVVIHTNLVDFLRLAAGEMHPVRALLDNAVEVDGDIMIAARMLDMFGAVEPLDLGA